MPASGRGYGPKLGTLTRRNEEARMSDYVERMITERDELAGKIARLEEFLGGETFDALPRLDRSLMTEQMAHMRAYLGTLCRRIARTS
jgi:hypothetical protein